MGLQSVAIQRRTGMGLYPVTVGGAVQSFMARPSIVDPLYSENLFTMGGAVPPLGTDPATWPFPWDWRWWGPEKEDHESEELPKGSEPGPIMPLPEQAIPLTNIFALAIAGFFAVWLLQKT